MALPDAPMDISMVNAHRVPAEAFWEAGYLVDGYDRQELARQRGGWRAVPSWGADGWDLGSWPLVTIYMKESVGKFLLAENVEGDTGVYAFDTEAERSAACDTLAFFHWKMAGAEWVDGVETAAAMPGYLRGPYSETRHGEGRGGVDDA